MKEQLERFTKEAEKLGLRKNLPGTQVDFYGDLYDLNESNDFDEPAICDSYYLFNTAENAEPDNELILQIVEFENAEPVFQIWHDASPLMFARPSAEPDYIPLSRLNDPDVIEEFKNIVQFVYS